MALCTTTLPDGRSVHCVNSYEVDFSWQEIFSEDLTAHGLSLPKDGVYVDVGANIGLFALHLKDRCPEARLLCYEPIPSTFAALDRNIAAMDGNAEAFQMALGSAPGELTFDYFPAITALSTSQVTVGQDLAAGLRKLLFANGVTAETRAMLERAGVTHGLSDEDLIAEVFRSETVRAPVDTLTNRARFHGLEHIDLLKVDTEGAEKEVLAGISEDLWPRIRQLLLEIHIGREETDMIAADLERRGYRIAITDHPMSEGAAPVFHIHAARKH
jgi:FkbM family methyltransferase